MRSSLSTLGIVALPVLTLFASVPLRAQQPVEQLVTPAGILSVKSATGSDCAPSPECQLIVIDGKILFKDQHATLVSAYPSKEAPRLVEVQTSTDGNACCRENRLIDFTVSPPLIIKGVGGGKITPAENGVLIEQIEGTDDIGDSLANVFGYTWGAGSAVKLRQTVVFSQTPLNEKKYPDEVLSDPKLREPVLQVVGRQLFRDFRQSLGVASPIKVVGSRYVVGAGCTPLFCCGGASIFVLDPVEKTAWALQMQNQDCKPGNGKARMWGALSALDVVPKRELGQWLTQNGLTWNKVVVGEPLQATPSPKPAPADGGPLQFSAPASNNNPRPSTVQGREVAMVRHGGTYAVPVQINGAITLDFVLDSGATDVSIPSDVFTTLMETGTITTADTIGSATYRLADGSIKTALTFNIRSLKVGTTVVTNVKAAVAGDTGPLLLGMSFLGRFPAWSVDNSRHVLILK